ncbi:hypothetical protein TNCT_503731 [Trichonephila clavata]|uniref:Uncharacterized protein n=1 Tax=Trichonephila clavata TaxID=2740835 RepID=A0A8X6GJX8_TRICU|nr:hypothetical protein TNCT_503731 [Trichonephila clavata]
MGSRNESTHFKPIPANASTYIYNSTDENTSNIIPNADIQVEEKEQTDTFNSSASLSSASEIEMGSNSSLSNNSKFEMGYYNEAFHFTATPTDVSLENSSQENLNEAVVDSFRKKNVFKKMKSFLKKVVTNKSNGFSYKIF